MGTCAPPGAEIAELYRSLSKPLAEIVRIDLIHAPEPVVEDACQFAWSRLIVNHDRVRRETALPWLARTAVHEALKLLGRERRWVSLDEAREVVGDAELLAPDQRAEWTERLEALEALPGRQQRLLWLHAFGLNYAEIALHTGHTRRTVERQLLRARRALRELAE